MPKDSGNNTSAPSSASRQEHFIPASGCSVEGCHSGSIKDTVLKFLQDILESIHCWKRQKKIDFLKVSHWYSPLIFCFKIFRFYFFFFFGKNTQCIKKFTRSILCSFGSSTAKYFFGEYSVFSFSHKFPIISSDEKRDRRCLQAPIELLHGSPQLCIKVTRKTYFITDHNKIQRIFTKFYATMSWPLNVRTNDSLSTFSVMKFIMSQFFKKFHLTFFSCKTSCSSRIWCQFLHKITTTIVINHLNKKNVKFSLTIFFNQR